MGTPFGVYNHEKNEIVHAIKKYYEVSRDMSDSDIIRDIMEAVTYGLTEVAIMREQER